jgi:hypothetical protein
MALIDCPECGNRVSSNAPACPHCGNPIAHGSIADASFHGKGEGIFMKSLNCGCMIALFVLAVVVFFIVMVVNGSGSR